MCFEDSWTPSGLSFNIGEFCNLSSQVISLKGPFVTSTRNCGSLHSHLSPLFFFFKGGGGLLLLIYLFMAVLGLRFCARVFSSCGKWGPLFITVRGPLTVAASLVAEHRLQTRRLSNCGSRAQLLCGTWDLPRPELEPVSPALAGRFSTTAPRGKPPLLFIIESWLYLGTGPPGTRCYPQPLLYPDVPVHPGVVRLNLRGSDRCSFWSLSWQAEKAPRSSSFLHPVA